MASDESKYRGEYSWSIKDSLLKHMINAENGGKFQSSPFEMCGLRWCVDVCPNGDVNDCVGAFLVRLKLLSLPPKANKIIVCRRIYCKESQSGCSYIDSYKKNSSWGWPEYTLSLKEIINENFIELNLLIELKILRVINEGMFTNTIIYECDLYFNKPFETQKYKFIIDKKLTKLMKKSLNGKRFESPIYDNMWCLNIVPNEYNKDTKDCFIVYLIFCAFPKNISKLKVRWKIEWDEMQIITYCTNIFSIEGNKSEGWSENKLLFTTFKQHNLSEFVLELSIDILEMYDNNNKKINFADWNNYINDNKNMNEFEEKKQLDINKNINNVKLQSIIIRMDENIKSLSQKIKDIETQQHSIIERLTTMEENEQKQNVKDPNELMTEFRKIQEQMNKLTQLQPNIDDDNKEMSEKDKIKNWMENTVKLGQYTEIFIDNGFDRIESIYDITQEELIEMGIDKMGHRKILIKHIQKLHNIKQSKPIHYPQIQQQQQLQQPIAPVAYNSNINNYKWKCVMCETQNGNDTLLCELCGLKRTYKKIAIEGINVVDTAQ